jgi:subtilisin family serine protease
MRKNKNSIGLLPYIREDIHGLGPDDAQLFGWEIKKFDIEKQWNISQGEDVKIAVIDTGCDLDHPDIKNNLLQGKNFVEKNTDPIDRCGHGTHCAGTIAAENNGIGMVGVAPRSKIIPVKALDDNGQGNINNIIEAIRWSADNNADIISMSLGSPNTFSSLENAIKYAASKGCIIFCAAGNNGPETDIMYPAKYDNTIAIGAVDRNLNRTNFTCSGDTLDFLAPGHEILSCVPGNKYALMSGTSMSTPFAVGCAALLLSAYKAKNKSHLLKNVNNYIEIFKKKTKSLSDISYAGIKKYEGYGILYPVL